jgi:hypothetical protein
MRATIPTIPSIPTVPNLGGGDSLDPDAQAYFTRAGVTDATAKNRINIFVAGMKSLGLFSLLTGCWIGRSAYNAGAGTTVFDLVSVSLDGTFVNTPEWSTNGLTFNADTDAVTTGRTQTMNGSWTAVSVASDGVGDVTGSRRVFGSMTGPSLLFILGTNKAATAIGAFDGTLFPNAGTIDVTTLKMLSVVSSPGAQTFYSGSTSAGTGTASLGAASHAVQLASSAATSGMSAGTISVGMIFGATALSEPQISSLYTLLKNSICIDQSLP